MNFENLEQRMAKSYIDLFPKFIPDENAPVNISEQKEFYLIMKNLFQLGFDDPLLFVSSLNEDDAFPERYKKSYGKPQLVVNMNKFIKSMDSLLQNMFLIGQNSIVQFSRRQQMVLLKLGISNFLNLPKAWTWMAKRYESNIISFSRCFFKSDYPYQADFYASLFGEPSFRKLENWMLKQGYKRYDIYDINKWHCNLSLTYANPLWNKEPPKSGWEYKIRHTGISAAYDPHYKNPAVFGLCIPNGLRIFLESFESMDKKLQKLIVNRTKKCDGCRYCVQTDKTGSRPYAFITVEYEQKKLNLCPYFPGYNYSWNSINDDLAEQIIDFLSFMDKFINGREDILCKL